MVPAPKMVLRAKRCENCGCLGVRLMPNGHVQKECRMKTPTPMVLPTPQGVSIISVWPGVENDQFCIEGWRPRVELPPDAN